MVASFKRDKNGNPVNPPMPTISPVATPGLPTSISDYGFIQAELFSLDDGSTLKLLIPPAEFELSGDTTWDKPGVIFASPQPGEYRTTNPTMFTIHACLDGYSDTGAGFDGTITPEIKMIEQLRRRIPGRNRAHICMYMQGAMPPFIGKLVHYHAQIRRLNHQGDFLQALAVEIALEEEKWNGL